MARSNAAAIVIGVACCLAARGAWAAQTSDPSGPDVPAFTPTLVGLRFDASPDRVTGPVGLAMLGLSLDLAADPQTSPPPVAVTYSHGYEVRNRIQHVASYATLPLFGLAVYTGQKLFNDPAAATSGLRHLHGTIAVAITGLFAVNSVTGIWNMMEARKDPHGLTLRTIHGVLMLVGEAGFMATALDRPNGRTASGLAIYTDKKNQHLALAYASLSVATVGYVLMLFR